MTDDAQEACVHLTQCTQEATGFIFAVGIDLLRQISACHSLGCRDCKAKRHSNAARDEECKHDCGNDGNNRHHDNRLLCDLRKMGDRLALRRPRIGKAMDKCAYTVAVGAAGAAAGTLYRL